MNKYPEMYASQHNRRPCVRRPFYHNNQKIYLEVQYCPDTGNMNVIKIHPEMKDGTEYYSILVELGRDLTGQLQSHDTIEEALEKLGSRSMRRADGTPITFRGAILDKLIADPDLFN